MGKAGSPSTSGTQSSARPNPARSKDAAPQARTTARLFSNDVLKARPGQDRKNEVVEDEEAEVASGIGRDRGAHAPHDHRDHEGEEEQRQAERPGPARTPPPRAGRSEP